MQHQKSHIQKYVLLTAAVGFSAAFAISLSATPRHQAPASPASTSVKLDGQRTLGAPKGYKNLTLIPVYDAAARATDTYMTLDEGLKAKVVKVKESGQGGEVNTLFVTNGGRKPLYLMAGEVVLGGQQDRCLGRDVIIPPDKHNQPVTVFCVEHGRWTGRKEFADSAKSVASADIRASAQEGAFAAQRATLAAASAPAAPANLREDSANANLQVNAIGGRSAAANSRQLSGRTAYVDAVGHEQQKVWDKVEQKNARFKAANATGTYRGVLNQSGGESHSSIEPYVKALKGSLSTDPHLVGMVAAVNGKVVSADIFGDPALFKKLWPKLLRSYAADAAENAPAKGQKVVGVTPEAARAFLIAASDAKSKMENKSDVSSTLRLETKSSLTYRLNSPPKAGGGMGGAAIHTNVLSK